MGCRMTASQCSRSHEAIRTKGLHWTVQAQILRRGGVRTGPVVPPGQVDGKVEALRRAADKEAASHKQPPKAGEASSSDAPAASASSDANPGKKQEVNGRVGESDTPDWQPPAEYVAFDCTPMEETLRQWLLGPDPEWRRDAHGAKEYVPGVLPTDPLGQTRQAVLDEVAASPDGAAVSEAPDRLRAYVHTRLAEARMSKQALTLEDVLRDAYDLGDEELSHMAADALDCLGVRLPVEGDKAGATCVEIDTTDWSRGFPGVAMVTWQDEEWRALDYGDKLPFGEELCERYQVPKGTVEQRQCLLKSVAAAVLHARDGHLPAHGQVLATAQELRTGHWRAATEAKIGRAHV